MSTRKLFVLVISILAGGISTYILSADGDHYPTIIRRSPSVEPISTYERALHPSYPYCVIPGGAYSDEELRSAIRIDPVVQAHFQDFDLAKVRWDRTSKAESEYISYRVGKQVYWTKDKVTIPAGEVLFTDGTHWARARCGSRLSEMPFGLVSGDEPPADELLSPPAKPGLPTELANTPPYDDFSMIDPEVAERFPSVTSDPIDAPPGFALPDPSDTPAATLIVPSSEAGPPVGTQLSLSSAAPPVEPPVLTPLNSGLWGAPGEVFAPLDPLNTNFLPPGAAISPVPEPADFYLFLGAFVISLSALLRVMSPDTKTDAVEAAHDADGI